MVRFTRPSLSVSACCKRSKTGWHGRPGNEARKFSTVPARPYVHCVMFIQEEEEEEEEESTEEMEEEEINEVREEKEGERKRKEVGEASEGR